MAENEIDRVRVVAPEPTESAYDEEQDSSIDFGALFQNLRRCKWQIVWGTLGVFAAATALAFSISPRYTSAATFIPPNLGGGSSMAAALAGQLSSLGVGDLLGGVKSSGDLYAAMLQSRTVASELVKQFDLMRVYGVKKESQAEKELNAATTVSVDAKTSIVTLDVTDKNPRLAHDLANAYMEALRETNGRLALDQSSQRRLFFGEQLAKEKDELENAEVDLKKTEERSGLIAPSGQTEMEIGTIAQTQAQIAIRQVQLAALRNSATEQNPEVIRLRSEIDDLQGQLERLQRGGNSKSSAAIPTSKVPEVQLEYVRKEREVKYHEALFEMLSRQFEGARLDEARDSPVLQVLDAASYPDTKSSPKRSYYMLGGLVLGFFGSCVWVLTRERIQGLRAAWSANQPA
jgi:tyrosine-protein kinase Etk/Wzc